MATYQGIAAVSRVILELLKAARPRPEFENALFEAYLASDFQKPMDEGVSLYLYRVGTSSRRNLPSRIGPNGQHYRPPLPVDLYYMLTAWAKTAEKQQRLLGFCMRELGDTPILPAGVLNHASPEPDIFHPDETVELVFEPLSIQDLASLWEPLKPNLQASATYVARMVSIESTVEVADFRPVQTREFDIKDFTSAGG